MRRQITFILLTLLLSACVRRIPKEQYFHIFSDDFSRTNQSLDATSRWVIEEPAGSVFQVYNQMALPAQGSGAAPSGFYSTRMGLDDGMVTVKINVLGGSPPHPNAMILGRYDTNLVSTATNGYACGFDSSNYLSIQRNGVTIQTGTEFFPFTQNDTYTLTFLQEGSDVQCKIEGNDTEDHVGFSESSPWENGFYFGLTGGENTTNYIFFDDFIVYGK